MFKISRYIFPVLFILTGFSQPPPDHNTYELISENLDSSYSIPNIPSLEAVIDSAKIYSPLVKSFRTTVEIEKTDVKSQKREILKSLSLFSNYMYGNNGLLTPEQNLLNNTLTYSPNIRTVNYQIGVQLRLDLFSVVDRQNKINREKLDVVYAENEYIRIELQLKEQIIRQYRSLELSQKLLSIYAATKQSAYVNLQMAERQFLDGEINISDVTRVTDALTKATTEFEKAKSSYLIAYEMLELTVGIKFDL